MIDYKEIFHLITSNPRYQRNLDWGETRPGHPEGTIRAHIAELEVNLETLRHKLSETDYWRLGSTGPGLVGNSWHPSSACGGC